MKTWLKHLFALALLAAVIPLDAGVIVKDLHPGKTPDTKNIKFTKSSDLCTMEFGSGNGPKARAWMRQYHPMLNIGERLKISLQVRSSNVSGANSRVFINVLTLDGKRKNLNSKSFDKMFPLTGTNGKWQKIEFVFTMPDPAVTRNWQNGKILLIAFGAAAQTGLFEFKDFTVEKLQPLALTQQTSRKLYQSSLNNPDFVYNVKTSAQTPAQSFDILLPAVADMNGYQPILSFDFALEKDSPQVMPVLEVDGKVMPEHDHRHLPRLLNAKNPSDGGSKRYMYNLKKILSTSNILSVRISAGDKSRFTVKNIKLSYKAETWPLYPDAPKPQKNALTILPGKSLRVNLNGKPLIVGENVTGTADLEKLDDKALHITRKDGRIVTHNLVQLNDPTVDFRREARILPNGELEIFMRNYYKKRSPESIGYRFMMPADFLRGAKFELLCGRGSKNTTVKGKLEFGNERFIRNIFPNEKTGIPVTHIQYLCLEKDGGGALPGRANSDATGNRTWHGASDPAYRMMRGGYLTGERHEIDAECCDKYFKCPTNLNEEYSVSGTTGDISYKWYLNFGSDATGIDRRGIVGRDNPNRAIWSDIVQYGATNPSGNHPAVSNVLYLGGNVGTREYEFDSVPTANQLDATD